MVAVPFSKRSPEELEELHRLSEAQKARKTEAIEAGFALVTRELTPVERRVVASHVDLSLDYYTVVDHPVTDEAFEVIRDIAYYTADSALLCKALIAIYMELSLTDDENVVDGPVGRALDEAIGVLEPLARARHGDKYIL